MASPINKHHITLLLLNLLRPNHIKPQQAFIRLIDNTSFEFRDKYAFSKLLGNNDFYIWEGVDLNVQHA